MATQPAVAELYVRILAEYREMPGLRLSVAQAARLLGLEPTACETLLETLVGEGRLARSARGEYCSRGDAEWVKHWRGAGHRSNR